MTKSYKIVKLLFGSPLHIHKGKGGYDVSEEILHSDTISSAMAAMGYKLDESFDGLSFLENVVVSSAFPFYEDQFFLPKPMVKLPLEIKEYDEKESSREAKDLKKLKYIEKDMFEQLITTDKTVLISTDDLKVGGQYLSAKSLNQFIKTSTQQRVHVPRDNSDSTPYYLERIYFDQSKGKTGLYFFLETGSEYFEKAIELLCFLGDEGIGTDRAVGNGQFRVEVDVMELRLPESQNRLALSLYWPTAEEIKSGILENSSYNLVKRGGFIAGYNHTQFRHLRKNSIYMFTEGSVFSSGSLTGRVGSLRPEWNDPMLDDIYRSGKVFTIPIYYKKS